MGGGIMTRVVWSNSQLNEKMVKFLEANGHCTPETGIGPHTLLRRLKENNRNVILGISRVKDQLYYLKDSSEIGKTVSDKYYVLDGSKKTRKENRGGDDSGK